MSDDSDLAAAPPPLPEFYGVLQTDLPSREAQLPDGREAVLSGDPEAILAHCRPASAGVSASLALAARLLRRFSIEVDDDALAASGELPLEELAELLSSYGLPGHAERAFSVEDLAHAFESGAGLMLAVNAGELWNDASALGSGECNDAVLLAAVARDPASGEVLGMFVSGADQGCWSRFVEVESVRRACIDTGGWHLVTDLVVSE